MFMERIRPAETPSAETPSIGNETKLEMALRHVREGSARVKRQRETLAEMRSNGYPTELTEAILESFEELLQAHQVHLHSIMARENPKRRFSLADRSIYVPLHLVRQLVTGSRAPKS